MDYAKDVALVAETFVDKRANVVDEAGYLRVAGVADTWQGNGLAKMMLAKLECCAVAVGIRWLIAKTLAINEAVIARATRDFRRAVPFGG